MTKATAILLALTLLAALAGCADDPAPPAEEAAPAIQYEDETIAVQDPSLLPRDEPAAGERTLDAAPVWRLGEWWKYRLTDEFVGETYEFYRVVAGSEAGNFLVGFPVNEFSNDIMIMHVPGYGDISRADLSYETHDSKFQMLQFPLRDGDSWEVSFEGSAPGTAIVELQADGTAVINALVNYNITAVYDPAIGEIKSLDIPGYASYEVIGHGYDWGSHPDAGDGVVRVPHDHDLVFLHGRLAGVQDLNSPLIPPTPSTPTEAVEVPAGYDRLSFTIILGAPPGLVPGGQAPVGYFSEKATAPDGTLYELALSPAEGQFKIEFYGHDLPEGVWNLEHIAAGAGVVLVEGIGYHSIDIDLPSGCVIASFNAGHHNANCRTTFDQANADGGNATAA